MSQNVPKDILDVWLSREQAEQDAFAKNYREIMACFLKLATDYNGKEQAQKTLLEYLRAWEIWLQFAFRTQVGKKLDEREERDAALIMDADDALTTNEILALARRSLADKLINTTKAQEHLDNLATRLGIFVASTDDVVLPTADKGRILPRADNDGEGVPVIEQMSQPRLAELIMFLQENDIYTDDILLRYGRVHRSMVRGDTYVTVEIPCLGKQILVCDRVGEATFVIDGIFSTEKIVSTTKTQLLEQYPQYVHKIIYNSSAQWQRDIAALLFKNPIDYADDELEITTDSIPEKLDVKTVEELKIAIKQKYPTSAQWFQVFCYKQYRSVMPPVLPNWGMVRVGNVFGVSNGTKRSKLICILIGLCVYGNDDPLLSNAKADELYIARLERGDEDAFVQLKAEVRKKYPTITDWLNGWSSGARKGKITPLFAVTKLATLFGLPDSVTKANYIALGQKIYGVTDIGTAAEAIESERLRNLAAENDLKKPGIIEATKKLYPTGADWVKLFTAVSAKEIKININGYTLLTMATVFGIEGDTQFKKRAFLLLGQAIYGEADNAIKLALAAEDRNDKLKAGDAAEIALLIFEVKKKYPTSQDWIAAWHSLAPGGFIAYDLGITKIARLLNVRGRIQTQKLLYLKLGQIIYGAEDVVLLQAMEVLSKVTKVKLL